MFVVKKGRGRRCRARQGSRVGPCLLSCTRLCTCGRALLYHAGKVVFFPKNILI